MKCILKNILKKIPRPVKVLFWAILALSVAGVYYIVLGCPTLSFEQAFRRAEKAYLLGPSTIVDKLAEYEEFDCTIVGESAYGITFFGSYRDQAGYDTLSYQEKTGEVTVAVPPNTFGFSWVHMDLPVYVFTEHSHAVRAEMDVQVTGVRTWLENNTKKSRTIQETFTAEATRCEEGYFRFWLKSDDDASGNALWFFSSLCNIGPALSDDIKQSSVSVTVRLYDADGQLIHTHALMLGANANTGAIEK